MSLINDMLRDLEARSQNEPSEPAADNVVTNAAMEGGRRLWILVFVACFAILAWAGYRLVGIPDKEETPTTGFETSVLIPPAQDRELAPLTVPAKAIRKEASDIKQEASSDEVGTPVLSVLGTLHVDSQAESTSIRLDFARLPEYRVLHDGSHLAPLVISFKKTQLGGDFVVPDLDGSMIDQISFLPRQDSLQMLIDRKKTTKVQGVEVIALEGEGARLKIDFIEDSQIHVPVGEGTDVAVVDTALVERPVDPDPAKEKTSVVKRQDLLSADVAAYVSGMELLAKGEMSNAQSLFESALDINPALADARLQLAKLQMGGDTFVDAEKTLAEGLSIAPDNRDIRKYYARFLLDQGRASEALVLMKSQAPALLDDLEYYALTAALHRETGDFQAAAVVYEQLLDVRSDNALWWMGLGIVREQMRQHEEARKAYRKAASLPGLRPALYAFVQERLNN